MLWAERAPATIKSWYSSDDTKTVQVRQKLVRLPGFVEVPFWATYLLDGLAHSRLLPRFPVAENIRPWRTLLEVSGVPLSEFAGRVLLARTHLYDQAPDSVRLYGLATLVAGGFEGGYRG